MHAPAYPDVPPMTTILFAASLFRLLGGLVMMVMLGEVGFVRTSDSQGNSSNNSSTGNSSSTYEWTTTTMAIS